MKLNAKELRDADEMEIGEKIKTLKRRPIYFILENIYDTYNIGGLFRLADALAIEKLYLCGDTEIPPNHRIKKASIGTYKVVPWEYKKSSKEVIDELRKNSNQSPTTNHQSPTTNHQSPTTNHQSPITIVAVEQDKTSVDYQKIEYSFPVALLVGNETYGVLPETLELCDNIAEIPMWGINKSLNVIVSAAIVSYHVASLL